MKTYAIRFAGIILTLLAIILGILLACQETFGQEKGRQNLGRTHIPLRDTTARWVKPKLAVQVIDQIRENLKQQDLLLSGWRQVLASLPQDSVLISDEFILRTLGALR